MSWQDVKDLAAGFLAIVFLPWMFIIICTLARP